MHITKSIFNFKTTEGEGTPHLGGFQVVNSALFFTARSLPNHLKASLLFCTLLTPTHPSDFTPLVPFCIIHQSSDLLNRMLGKKKRRSNVTYILLHSYSLLLLVILFECPIDVTHGEVDILQMQHESPGVYGSTFNIKMLLGFQVHRLNVSH